MRRRKTKLPEWLKAAVDRLAYVIAASVIASIGSYFKGSDDKAKEVAPVIRELKASNIELDDALTFSLEYYGPGARP